MSKRDTRRPLCSRLSALVQRELGDKDKQSRRRGGKWKLGGGPELLDTGDLGPWEMQFVVNVKKNVKGEYLEGREGSREGVNSALV